ncbi:hypothetical protein O6H91_05G054000 [Diphasiastrum complanatum]|uniref:Uncharacterized protein n=1 Tax=Diphasiastrum complanatum TaxID=34168 RepID=A0ACC2DN97_DIPCM|nr:hypothetical protein O6H91_05G054000 [Diphasiastrum complanatum]
MDNQACIMDHSDRERSLLSHPRIRQENFSGDNVNRTMKHVEVSSFRHSFLVSLWKSYAGLINSSLNRVSLILVALLVSSCVYVLHRHDMFWSSTNLSHGNYRHFHNRFLEWGCNESISKHLRELTREPHVAGTTEDFVTASYVHSVFESYGLTAHYADYNVLLTYPLNRSLSLTLTNGTTFNFSLTEEPVEGDPYSHNPRAIPTFLAYSPSGEITAEVVYANYGRDEDFKKLKELGILVAGAVVIARYGAIFRGDIVDNAEAAGAVGVLIYSDPWDYGGNRTESFYPYSKWLPPTGVQRGSLRHDKGDPLTPGWPSTATAERLDISDPALGLPKIPSLPISAQDALPILSTIGGPVAPLSWHGALDLPAYRLGRGPGELHLTYHSNQTVMPIRNVIAVITGSKDPDRYVVLGNHRDAWTFGAADPNSGTSSLLEVARRLGNLLKLGWRPRRTIILCNWDAEEYALIGSTEWVEENLDLLATRAVAYLNVDVGVSGQGFGASSTPQLDALIRRITRKVKNPDAKGTVYDSWVSSSEGSDSFLGRLGGGGSDYAPFLQHAGVPAVDFFFGHDYPVYHSLYDNYHWMENFGDTFFRRHVAVSSIWGLLALRLADDAVLPFDYTTYGYELQVYVKKIEEELLSAEAPTCMTAAPLHEAITAFIEGAVQVKKESHVLMSFQTGKEDGSWDSKRSSINERLILAERSFLDVDGLPNKSWYKHLVYGPTQHNHYGTSFFPAIFDSITYAKGEDAKGWAKVQHEIWRASRVVRRAALVLVGKLT